MAVIYHSELIISIITTLPINLLWEGTMAHIINLPHGGQDSYFDANDLVSYIRDSLRGYIIQGQQNRSLGEHTKPRSLDYWLRVKYAENKDIKQAVNSVIKTLAKTGKFEVAKNLQCPDTGNLCKGIKLRYT